MSVSKSNPKTSSRSNLHAAELAAQEVTASISAPKQGAPMPPKGFVKLPPKRGRKVPLQRAQLACAAQVASELRAMPVEELGPHAPPPGALGAAMALAAGWSRERSRADAWRAFAHAQELTAWTPVLVELAAFRPAFEYALGRDPSVADRHPQLALFFGLGKQLGAKAVRTRQARKRAADKAKAAPVAEVPVHGPVATVH